MENDIDLLDWIEDELNSTPFMQKSVFRICSRPDRMAIHFQSLETLEPLEDELYLAIKGAGSCNSVVESQEDEFYLAIKKTDSCNSVVERVADQLRVDDASKIRLTARSCFTREPVDKHIDYRCSGPLWDRLIMWDKLSDIMYYEVLDIPLPELESLRTLHVAYSYPSYSEMKLLLDNQSTVADLLAEIKKMITPISTCKEKEAPDAELRLLGIFNGKISQIFRPDEKIEKIPVGLQLRAEEILEEEKNLGPKAHLIRVYHFTKENSPRIEGEAFGDPFCLVIYEDETLRDVKKRLFTKLKVTCEDFSKWKFVLLRRLIGPKYLEDTDVLSNYFEEGVARVQLGLEHSAGI